MSIDKNDKSELSKVLTRLKKALGKDFDYQVGEELGIERTALSQRKKRGSVPVDKVELLCSMKGINVNWVYTGEGPMLNPDPLPAPNTPSPSAPLGDGALDRALWSEATLDSQALFGDILEENVQKCYDRLLVKQGRSPESPPSAKTETPLKQAA